MSLQLTLARAELRAADQDWRDHLLHCPLCAAATRERKWDRLCDAGFSARERNVTARAAVEYERAADKAPAPDQEPLW